MSNETINKISNFVFIATCIILVGFASLRVWGGSRPETPAVDEARVNPFPKGLQIPDSRACHLQMPV